jgi:hypothetical protein
MTVSDGFRLDPGMVEATFAECVSSDGTVEVDALVGPVMFEGSVQPLRLDKAKLADHGEQIAAMLLELPVEFRESGGGGWSFLNACMDRHGTLWTGMHATMAKLFALGQGTGMVTCQFPREIWDVLPGGVPYYVINDRSFGRAGEPR